MQLANTILETTTRCGNETWQRYDATMRRANPNDEEQQHGDKIVQRQDTKTHDKPNDDTQQNEGEPRHR